MVHAMRAAPSSPSARCQRVAERSWHPSVGIPSGTSSKYHAYAPGNVGRAECNGR
jgi:hypothetical protein